MKNTNAIGLDMKKTKKLVKKLNELLANHSNFYQNTKGYHWNIKVEMFFDLPLKFKGLYNDLLIKFDEAAEGILTTGHSPEHRYSIYTRMLTIQENDKIHDGTAVVKYMLEAFQRAITMQREILGLSDEANNKETHAHRSHCIRFQEKQEWMHSSFLTNN